MQAKLVLGAGLRFLLRHNSCSALRDNESTWHASASAYRRGEQVQLQSRSIHRATASLREPRHPPLPSCPGDALLLLELVRSLVLHRLFSLFVLGAVWIGKKTVGSAQRVAFTTLLVFVLGAVVDRTVGAQFCARSSVHNASYQALPQC
jgi:hypothetical protein